MENLCKNFEDTYTDAGIIRIFHFNKCLSYLTYLGKNLYGDHFEIVPADIPIIHKLIIYMVKEHNMAEKIGLDLSKGILLTGPIGCGKTSLMHLVKHFAKPSTNFKIATCRDITFDFAKNGFEVIQHYTSKSQYQTHLPTYCFDDLGSEQQIKHYGINANVMAEILISRYEHFVQNGSITHLTTNLSASEIENLYGNRLRSRMRSMFNVIAFNPDAQDKR